MSSDERGRRDEILEAALKCFLEKGYDATTINDIRERSGASTGSIYHAFSGKDAIAAELLAGTLDHWQRTLLARLERETTAEGLVRGAVEHFVDWVAQAPDRARFLFHSPRARLESAAQEGLQARNAELLVALKAMFRPHVKARALRALPTSLLLPIIVGPAMEWARTWLAGRSPTGPAEARRVLADAAWAALRA